MYYCQESEGTPSRLFVTNGTRTMCYYIYFYTNMCVLAPFVMFHDAKPQPVKTPLEGKPIICKQNITKSYMPMFIANIY